MNNSTVIIVNTSDSLPIIIAFSPPENAQEPSLSQGKLIPPQKNIVMGAEAGEGTLNLFVRKGEEPHEVIWKGVVPIKISKPLQIFPETKIVKYDNLVLPEGFSPVTDLSEYTEKKSTWSWKILLIVGVIIVVLLIWCSKKI